jgi:hypothetical protein
MFLVHDDLRKSGSFEDPTVHAVRIGEMAG